MLEDGVSPQGARQAEGLMITLKRSLWVILGLDPRIHVFNGSWMVRSPSEVTWGRP